MIMIFKTNTLLTTLLATILLVTSCDENTAGGDSCGDHILDTGEECDGENLGDQTCQSMGYYGGELTCSSCSLDLSECTASGWCGDGVVQGDNEACDGESFGNLSCESLGYPGGTLSCSNNCTVDVSTCVGGENCGDGVMSLPEQCDGDDMGGVRCDDFDDFSGGALGCTTSCRFDISTCTVAPLCGDTYISGAEQCDTVDLGGASCQTLGYYSGALACDTSCHFDLSDCELAGRCGDDILQEFEECDTSMLGGATCTSLGFSPGTLSCTPSCLYDTAGCTGVCGDDTLQTGLGEECDGVDTITCQELGYWHGGTSCDATCTLHTNCTHAVQWGSSAADYALDMAMDSAGNFYVAGYTAGAMVGGAYHGSTDLFLRKLDASGTEIWTLQWGTGAAEKLTSVAVDHNDQVFVAGESSGNLGTHINQGGSDIYVGKFDSSGNELWSTFVATGSTDVASGLTVTSTGDPIVTGHTFGTLAGATSQGMMDAILVKLDGATGSTLWTRQLGSTYMDWGSGVTVDENDNIYMTGRAEGSVNGVANVAGIDLLLCSYTSDGTHRWTTIRGTSGTDLGVALHVEGNGSLLLLGSSSGDFAGNTNLGGTDIVISRVIANTGSVLWTKQHGTAGMDTPTALVADSLGTIYITSFTTGAFGTNLSMGGKDMALLTLTLGGQVVDVFQYGTAEDETTGGMVLDASEIPLACGSTSGTLGPTSAGSSDAFLLKHPITP